MATTRPDIGYSKVDWQGTWFSDHTDGPYSITSTDSRVGGSVRNWKRKIAECTDATGNYSRTIIRQGLIRGEVVFTITNPNQGNQRQQMRMHGVITNSGSGHPAAPSVPTNSQDTQARINFMKKVRKTQRGFQTGVFLGELRETIHMVTRPASALRHAISSYSSAAKYAYGRAGGGRRGLKAVSGTWLEHSYGWRPLFSDIDQGMSALARLPRVYGEVITGYSEQRTVAGPAKWNPIWENTTVQLQFMDVNTTRVRYKGMLAFANDRSKAEEWNQKWGLTLSDFAPTAWELIPYSFLVDYFTNVGDIIDTASMGTVALRWGFKSSFAAGQRILTSYKLANIGGWSPNSTWHWTPNSLVCVCPELSRVQFDRTSISSVSVGISDFQVKVPGVDDWRKWANIAALAVEKIL